LHDRARWRLVGNAVSVPAARWVAARILDPSPERPAATGIIRSGDMLPRAAFGWNTRRYLTTVPEPTTRHEPILTFLNYDTRPLSYAATHGFRRRYEQSRLRKDAAFIAALRIHERNMRAASA